MSKIYVKMSGLGDAIGTYVGNMNPAAGRATSMCNVLFPIKFLFDLYVKGYENALEFETAKATAVAGLVEDESEESEALLNQVGTLNFKITGSPQPTIAPSLEASRGHVTADVYAYDESTDTYTTYATCEPWVGTTGYATTNNSDIEWLDTNELPAEAIVEMDSEVWELYLDIKNNPDNYPDVTNYNVPYGTFTQCTEQDWLSFNGGAADDTGDEPEWEPIKYGRQQIVDRLKVNKAAMLNRVHGAKHVSGKQELRYINGDHTEILPVVRRTREEMPLWLARALTHEHELVPQEGMEEVYKSNVALGLLDGIRNRYKPAVGDLTINTSAWGAGMLHNSSTAVIFKYSVSQFSTLGKDADLTKEYNDSTLSKTIASELHEGTSSGKVFVVGYFGAVQVHPGICVYPVNGDTHGRKICVIDPTVFTDSIVEFIKGYTINPTTGNTTVGIYDKVELAAPSGTLTGSGSITSGGGSHQYTTLYVLNVTEQKIPVVNGVYTGRINAATYEAQDKFTLFGNAREGMCVAHSNGFVDYKAAANDDMAKKLYLVGETGVFNTYDDSVSVMFFRDNGVDNWSRIWNKEVPMGQLVLPAFTMPSDVTHCTRLYDTDPVWTPVFSEEVFDEIGSRLVSKTLMDDNVKHIFCGGDYDEYLEDPTVSFESLNTQLFRYEAANGAAMALFGGSGILSNKSSTMDYSKFTDGYTKEAWLNVLQSYAHSDDTVFDADTDIVGWVARFSLGSATAQPMYSAGGTVEPLQFNNASNVYLYKPTTRFADLEFGTIYAPCAISQGTSVTMQTGWSHAGATIEYLLDYVDLNNTITIEVPNDTSTIRYLTQCIEEDSVLSKYCVAREHDSATHSTSYTFDFSDVEEYDKSMYTAIARYEAATHAGQTIAYITSPGYAALKAPAL